MKLIDREQGKILGVNFVDALVAVVVLFVALSFISKLLMPPLTFTGEQMTTAIVTYQKLDSKGFLIEAGVKGKWIGSGEDFSSDGLIIDTRSGALQLKKRDATALWVGGSMGYLEDIAVSRIEFRPLGNYVVSYDLQPRSFSSYEELLRNLRGFSEELKADNLLLTLDISFINPDKSAQELMNEFGKLYLVKYYSLLPGRESEVILRVELAELSELEKIKVKTDRVTIGGRPDKRKVLLTYESDPLEKVGAEKLAASGKKLGSDSKYRLASLKELI